MSKPPYITAADVEGALGWVEVADALAAGHLGPRPQISDQFVSRGEDTLLSRAAWIDGLGIAVKSATIMPANTGKGLPSVHGAMVLFEDKTGQVEAVIDSALVTKWKTAGDSVLGARYLARKDSKTLLILGAGAVAASLIEAYRAILPGLNVAIWNRSPEKARTLAEAQGARHVTDLAKAVGQADIVASATMSKLPVLMGEWLRPGTHVDLIGAFTADMREADDEALRRSRIFVDALATTVDHIGELKIPIAAGVISRDDVLGDLFDLAQGRVGRGGDDEITLFKNGGGAHLDLLTGRVILAAWRRAIDG